MRFTWVSCFAFHLTFSFLYFVVRFCPVFQYFVQSIAPTSFSTKQTWLKWSSFEESEAPEVNKTQRQIDFEM